MDIFYKLGKLNIKKYNLLDLLQQVNVAFNDTFLIVTNEIANF